MRKIRRRDKFIYIEILYKESIKIEFIYEFVPKFEYKNKFLLWRNENSQNRYRGEGEKIKGGLKSKRSILRNE